MTGKILNDVEFLALIEKLSKKHIPVYVAGDLNASNHEELAIKNFTDYGFEILNLTGGFDPDYKHATKGKTYLDLILEYNTNPNHATLNRGIPHLEPFGGRYPVEWLGNVSDHYPYLVKVKLK